VPNRINSLILSVLSLCLWAPLALAQTSIPRAATGAARPAAKKSTVPAAGENPRSDSLPRTTRPAAGRVEPAEEPAETAAPQKPLGRPRHQALQGPVPQLPEKDGPAPQVVMQPVSEEMKSLLGVWEDKTKGITSLYCPITRYEFDSVFAIETRSEGTICFENPDKGRIDFKPASADRMAMKPRTINGKPYKLQEGSHSRWICTGKVIYIMDMTAKTYDRVQIPPQMQGQNITRSPLPFIFGMKAKDVMERFALRFGQWHNPDGTRMDEDGKPMRQVLHIVANPLDPNVAKEYTQAEIVLDPKTFRPMNLRTRDPSGNKETVYSFDQSKLQEPVSWGLKSPFKEPLLIGWQLMHDQKAEPERKAEKDDASKGELK